MTDKINPETDENTTDDSRKKSGEPSPETSDEMGGPSGLEPTRYGDWERKGICYDF